MEWYKEIRFKSDSDFIKYLNPNMVSSNTMGFRINLGDHMYFLTVG